MLTNIKPGFYLGIDTGGTKTEAIIVNESGFVVGIGQSDVANLHNIDADIAFAHVHQAIENAKADAQGHHPEIKIGKIEVACLGLSGLDTEQDRQNFKEKFRKFSSIFGCQAKKLIVTSNALSGLMSGTEEAAGVCLIAATGSNCYGLSRNGKEATAGNWGFFLGDQGSAYSIGRQLLQHVMKEYDGRAPKSLLTKKVLNHLKLSDASELVRWAYSAKFPVKEVASLAMICDSPEADELLEVNRAVLGVIDELDHSYRAVISRLNFNPNDKFPVVLIGGLFRMKNKFKDSIIRSIRDVTPNVEIVFPTYSVAEGAARIARMHEQLKLFPESLMVIMMPD